MSDAGRDWAGVNEKPFIGWMEVMIWLVGAISSRLTTRYFNHSFPEFTDATLPMTCTTIDDGTRLT